MMKYDQRYNPLIVVIFMIALTVFGLIYQVHHQEYHTDSLQLLGCGGRNPALERAMTPTYQQLLMVQAAIERQKYVEAIVAKYPVDKSMAEKIVQAAQQNQQPIFPRTKDILAIIGIESSFRHNVSSKLASDPAVGLMQVRTGIWKREIRPSTLEHIEGQIEAGSYVLTKYYQDTHSKLGAVMAYNVGITAYRRGKTNWRYVDKYRDELQWLGETHE